MPINYMGLIEGHWQNLNWVITLRFQTIGTPPVASMDAWDAAAKEIWGPGTAGNAGWRQFTNAATVDDSHAVYQFTGDWKTKLGVQRKAAGVAGTNVNHGSHIGMAAGVGMISVGTSGKHMGHIYLPNPTVDHCYDSGLEAIVLTTTLTAVKQALTSLYASGYAPGVVDQKTGEFRSTTDIRMSNKPVFRRSRGTGQFITYFPEHVYP